MIKEHRCPNCGAAIELLPKSDHLHCSQCNAELIVESGSKLFLANPSSPYLDQDRMSHPADLALQNSTSSSPPLSESRQERFDLLTQERIAQEKNRRQEGVFFGYLGIAIGLLGLGGLGIQIYLSGANKFNIAGAGLAIIFVCFEVGVVLWYRKAFPLDK
jgi:hypothetical protein